MIQARVVSGPVNEPITIEECYQQMHLDEIDSNGRPDDALIMGYVAAAREYCENFTGVSFALKDYEIVLSAFPATIELPYPPFISLLNGITISDEISDNEIDEESYIVDDFSGDFAIISPVSSWPTLETGNRVRIRYRAGYGDESEAYGHIPASIKQAMLLLVGHWYSNREAVNVGNIVTPMDLAVESLLRPYRIRLGMA